MSIEEELFKNFKDIDASVEAHNRAITEFRNDPKSSVLAIDSIQGSGKTTSFISSFATDKDNVLITQSNDKLEELVGIVDEKYPGLRYHAIWGLEQSCETYLYDEVLHDQVGHWREIGLYTKDIHERICDHNDQCDFNTQEKKLVGRTAQTVERFINQLTFGRLYHGLYPGRLILIDEADGLLDYRKISDEVGRSLKAYKLEKIELNSNYLPDIYKIRVPEKEITGLTKHYKELLGDIDGNSKEIKEITGLIRILTKGFVVRKLSKNKYGQQVTTYEEFYEIPNFFLLCQKILRHRLKLVIGTASLRHQRIKFHSFEDYFRLANELLEEEIVERGGNGYDNLEDFEKLVSLYDYLIDLEPKIREFRSSYIPGFTKLYAFRFVKHSYSMGHYSRAFNKNADESERKKVFRELRTEFIIVRRFYEKLENKKPKKILLITFGVVQKEIDRYIKKLKKQKKKDRSFSDVDVLPLFSNRMHGINANTEGYDLIVTIGDPLDRGTAEFATKLNIASTNRRGFMLKPKTDLRLKQLILESMVSELLEAYHRSRATIPIISLSNFLYQPEEEDQKIIRRILENDHISFIDLRGRIYKFRKSAKKGYAGWKEKSAFIKSVEEEINMDLNF